MTDSESVLTLPVDGIHLPPDEIHHSIIDADDMEEVWDDRVEVSDVIQNLISHPGQIITRWNWKTAMIGALVRAGFYFTIYQASRESMLVTLTAVLVELTFRFITTGMAGAVVQSFRRATPLWLANVIVSISLPAFSHAVEFATHYAQERYFYDIFAASENNVARQRAFAISVLFSVVSALFNLFLMKHGVLLVGAGTESKSFVSDLKRIPRMVAEFVAVLPNLIAKYLESGKVLNALLTFLGFGIAVGTILGTVRGKWQWAYRTAAGAWAILLFAVLVAVLARFIMRRRTLAYAE
jgi:hypothetical protein